MKVVTHISPHVPPVVAGRYTTVRVRGDAAGSDGHAHVYGLRSLRCSWSKCGRPAPLRIVRTYQARALLRRILTAQYVRNMERDYPPVMEEPREAAPWLS